MKLILKLITIFSVALLLCAITVQSEQLDTSPGEINKFEEAPENDEEVDSNWFELQHETIQQQADQPTSGEQFIAIRIGAVGSKDQVNPELEGLVRIALQFLPNSYTFINVISASREVVAGVKYELLVNALNENKTEIQCEIKVLEQPWIVTNENQKLRTLIYSNCSTDEQSSTEPKNDDVHQKINPIFNHEEVVMTEERLKNMESSILPTVEKKLSNTLQSSASQSPETDNLNLKENEEALTVVKLSKDTSSFLDDFFSFGKTDNKPIQGSFIENEVIPKVAATIERVDSDNTVYHVATILNGETQIAETSTPTVIEQTNSNDEPLNSEVSQIKCAQIQSIDFVPVTDPVIKMNEENIENINANLERQKRALLNDDDSIHMTKELYSKILKAALARLDRFDEDDNKRVVLNVHSVHVFKNLYTFDVTIADSKCSEIESSSQNCRLHITDDRIKMCRFEIEHLDNDDIKLKKSECVPITRVKRQVGRPQPASDSERKQALDFLKESLQSGDKQGYSLERIINVTVKRVAGILYEIKAEFSVDESSKICNVKIWDRPWLGESAREVTFNCDVPERRKRQILGGIETVPNSEVETLLNEVISEGDYQSYRLVRIIETTHQVVEGSLYRIKAEFSFENSTKVCNIKIWDRPWLSTGGRQVEFNCEDEILRPKRSNPPNPITVKGGIITLPDSEKSNVEKILNEVLVGSDYQSYSLIRIIKASRQTVAGSLYRIKAEFEVDETQKICNVKIWIKVSGQGKEITEFNCEAQDKRSKREIIGGITQTSDSDKTEIENLLNEVLSAGDYQSYRLVRIIEATHQVVEGSLYRIKAEFSFENSTKVCNIKIWDRPWLSTGGRQVEFNCEDDILRPKRSNPPNPITVKGGIITLPDSEKSNVEKILNEVLVGSDYQSYSLIRIIKASRQTVAGSLYRIKAEFEVDETQKICNVKIWIKVSGQGKEITEFNCEAQDKRSKREIIGGITQTSDSDKTEIENLLNEVLSAGDYQSYRLVRIIESNIQLDSGKIYNIKAELSIGHSLKICNIQIWDQVLLIKPSRKVKLNCGETSKIKRQIHGGFKSVEVREKEVDHEFLQYVETLLKEILQSCDYQSYKLIKILDSTSEVITGFMYRIKAEFNVNNLTKICNIKIWEKESNGGREVQEFICKDQNEQQSRITLSLNDASVGRSLIESSDDETIQIETLLKTALSGTTYTYYKLLKIINFTKPKDVDNFYRINAEFTINGVEQICDLKLPPKISELDKNIEEFNCIQKDSSQEVFKPTSEEDKPQVEKLLKEIFSYNDYQSYTLVKILQSWKQFATGINYKIRAEVKFKGESKICNIKILNMFTKHGNRAVQLVCQNGDHLHFIPSVATPQENHQPLAGSMSHTFKDDQIVAKNNTGIITTTQQNSISFPGSINAISEDDQSTIEKILNEVLAGTDYKSYRLVKILKSSKQVVAGLLYRIKAEFAVDGVQKICDVKILDKVSNQGREVQEFICEAASPLVVVRSLITDTITTPQINNLPLPLKDIIPVVGSGAGIITTPQPTSISFPGSINAISEDDQSAIEKILNEVLTGSDYQSYRLVKILESSKQVVAGLLYRIKAEFAVDGVQKICNVKILDNVSNQGREVQEFICKAASPLVVVGSLISDTITTPQINNLPLPLKDIIPVVGSGADIITTPQPTSISFPGSINAISEDDQSAIEKILNEVLTGSDYQSYRLVKILESSKQVVAGLLYRIKAEFAVDGVQKICNVKILDKVSNQGREVQEFICEAASPLVVVRSLISDTITTPQINNLPLPLKDIIPVVGSGAGIITTPQPTSISFPGSINAISEDDQSAIEKILNEVLTGSDYQSYRLVKILKSSKQVVAGLLYRIKAEFDVDGVQKICNVKILDKVSNQGREVQEFICEAASPLIVVGSLISDTITTPQINNLPLPLKDIIPAVGSGAGIITTQPNSISFPGSINAISEDDQSAIEKILNEILTGSDYQSYRLVKILKSSKQVVAGLLYRIKAEFAVDGVQKICNVKILDKVSNQGREVQEFICEAASPLVVVGSLISDTITTPQINNLPLPLKDIIPAVGSGAGIITTPQPNSISFPGSINAISEDDQSAIEKILNEVLTGSDYQSYRLVKILKSSKQVVAGLLYRIKAEFAVDGVQKICNVKILDKVSNQGREVQEFICEAASPLVVVRSLISDTITTPQINNLPLPLKDIIPVVGSGAGIITTPQPTSISFPGSINAISEDDQSAIEKILNEVLTGSDYQSYRLVKILKSSKQVVAGLLYRIKAEFDVDGVQKICNVKILDKVSNQGREVQEFICEAASPLIVVGSLISDTITTPQINNLPLPLKDIIPAVGSGAGIITTQPNSISFPGSINAISEDDQSAIEKILNEVLSGSDYQSYRLVKILKSSKQVVAGLLYRIKAEFAVDGVQKICNVKILDKVSNQGREVQEFICEAAFPLVVVGSLISDTITTPQINNLPLPLKDIIPVVGSGAGIITTPQPNSISFPGSINAISEDDLSAIEKILNDVLTGSDYQSYRLVKILESSKQVVAGLLYRIKAEFAVDGVQKICNVKILDKVSNQGREVQEFICEAASPLVVVGSLISDTITTPQINNLPLPLKDIIPAVGSGAGIITTPQPNSISFPGSINAISEDDQSAIEKILNEVLTGSDYQSYRLVKILKSSKQVVAGLLYRIKAVFAVDGVQKICNVKILDKVSNQGREVQEFICEAASPLVVVGSLISDSITTPQINNLPLPLKDIIPAVGSGAGIITTPQPNSISFPESINAICEDDQSVIEKILNEVLTGSDYQSYRLVKILESSKQVVAGLLYRIKAEFAVDGVQKICNVKILDKVSNQGREVQEFICEAASPLVVVGSLISDSITTPQINNLPLPLKDIIPAVGSGAGIITTPQPNSISFPGSINAISEDDQSVIEKILNEVLTGSDYQSYRLVKILESSKQVVAGLLYRIKAEFAVDGVQKICNVKILDKVSNQGREVQEFICEAASPLVIVGSLISDSITTPQINNLPLPLKDIIPVVGSGAGIITTPQPNSISFPGSINAISEDDQSAIEKILNEVLSGSDYQSYRLVKILESSKQVVAGLLYRIKAEFVVDGVQKICNVKILDKVSNQGREVQEFICEAASPLVVVGSLISDTITTPQINNLPLPLKDIIPAVGSGAGIITTTQPNSISFPGSINTISEDDQSVIEKILNEILTGSDYQSYRLVKILKSSTQVVAGLLYRIKAEFTVDGVQKICNLKILDKVSNQGREVQEFICEAASPLVFVESLISDTITTPQINNLPLPLKDIIPAAGSDAGIITTTQQNSISFPGSINALSEEDQSVIEKILNEVLTGSDYQSYRLVKILKSSTQVVAGLLYRIKAEFAVDGVQKICNVKILDKVSNQGREVQEFICEAASPLVIVGSVISDTITTPQINNLPLPLNDITPAAGSGAGIITTTQQNSISFPGSINAISEDDQSVIENILNEVLTGSDYQSYRLVKILKSSKQVVAGSLYRIKAEFAVDGVQKICNVKILDKVSNQGREVQEFICEAASPLVIVGSLISDTITTPQINNLPLPLNDITPAAGSGAGIITTTQQNSISFPGSINAISEDDQSVIENILNEVLTGSDYQSYRLVKILKSSKQVVAGSLYRIKAEFAVDGVQKICNVKILDKVSNQGREVQEFICEATSPLVIVGSLISDTITTPQISNLPLPLKDITPVVGSSTGIITTPQPNSISFPGSINAISEDDQSAIEKILNEVLTGSDYQSYRLVKILESSKQVVAGLLYRIKAEFAVDGVQKICNVKILDKISNQGREVQGFNCGE